ETELRLAAQPLGLALLPAAAAARADVLLVADGHGASALDDVRAERLRAPERTIVVVAERAGAIDAAEAMASGARGLVEPQLASGPCCRVLPAPALPEEADLVDETGVARVLAALPPDTNVVVDGGQRIGVETVPALERASAIVVVATPDARGLDGADRLC